MSESYSEIGCTFTVFHSPLLGKGVDYDDLLPSNSENTRRHRERSVTLILESPIRAEFSSQLIERIKTDYCHTPITLIIRCRSIAWPCSPSVARRSSPASERESV